MRSDVRDKSGFSAGSAENVLSMKMTGQDSVANRNVT